MGGLRAFLCNYLPPLLVRCGIRIVLTTCNMMAPLLYSQTCQLRLSFCSFFLAPFGVKINLLTILHLAGRIEIC